MVQQAVCWLIRWSFHFFRSRGYFGIEATHSSAADNFVFGFGGMLAVAGGIATLL
jgi:hypothetical protein